MTRSRTAPATTRQSSSTATVRAARDRRAPNGAGSVVARTLADGSVV